jgi:hypothetical protein
MPLSIEDLCTRLDPFKTSLLLGAGASVPSGAPTGAQLAQKLWRTVANLDAQSDDLIETAGILERRYSRRSLIESLVTILRSLQPTGGLLALPTFGWHSIFTTNFDRLVEIAYKKANIPLTPIRSNFDFSSREIRTDISLYKLHGCISQDRALGDKASMILTEQDYDDFAKYRQSLFSLLQSELLTGDVLVIGQSLRDRHLSDLVKQVLNYKAQGAPGEVYALIYDPDDLRAPLLEDRGLKISFGSVDQFTHALASRHNPAAVPTPTEPTSLPRAIVSTVELVEHAHSREPNVVRMFNGGAATYADIKSGLTFERANLSLACDELANKGIPCLVVVGAAGVGKTTFARQLLFALSGKGYVAVEHRNDFPFESKLWISFEAELRANGRQAVLLLDECTRYLRQGNMLLDHLVTVTDPALRVVMTANAAQWGPRLKSPAVFKKGRVVELSRLGDADIHALINLVDRNRQIANLVQTDFKNLTRQARFARLRERCSADMFVCLINIFANESLDRILLVEYDELNPTAQEHYRYIAALESVGMRVHRQLVMRMLSLHADQVKPLLSGLLGIVDEFEINPEQGIYGWSTRHIVIARTITEYKFSSLEEIKELFHRIIENVNPAVQTELQSIRDLCDTDFGIGRLGDASIRKDLYRRLISIAPGERIPWHRLIRELLDEGAFEEAEYSIRDAIDSVGADAPIDRYRVRLLMARAEFTSGISPSDRVALLRRAYEIARINIERHAADKYSYRVLCEVAEEMVAKGESLYIFREAIELMRRGADKILDPGMDRELKQFDSAYSRLLQ